MVSKLNERALKELDKIYLEKLVADKKFRKKAIKALQESTELGIIPVKPSENTSVKPKRANRISSLEAIDIDLYHDFIPFSYIYNVLKHGEFINKPSDDDITDVLDGYSTFSEMDVLSNYKRTIRQFNRVSANIAIGDRIGNDSYINNIRFIADSVWDPRSDFARSMDPDGNFKMTPDKINSTIVTDYRIKKLRTSLFYAYTLHVSGWLEDYCSGYLAPIMKYLSFLGFFFTDKHTYMKYRQYLQGAAGMYAYGSSRNLTIEMAGPNSSLKVGFLGIDSVYRKGTDKDPFDECLARLYDSFGQLNDTVRARIEPVLVSLGVTQVDINSNGQYTFLDDRLYKDAIDRLYEITTSAINYLEKTCAKDSNKIRQIKLAVKTITEIYE